MGPRSRGAIYRLGESLERRGSIISAAAFFLASLGTVPIHPVSVVLSLRMLFVDGATRAVSATTVALTDSAADLLLQQQVSVYLLILALKLGLFWKRWGGWQRFARYHFFSQLVYLPLAPLFVLPSFTFDGFLPQLIAVYLALVGSTCGAVSVGVSIVGIARGPRPTRER